MAKVFQLQPGQPPLTASDADPNPTVVVQANQVTFATTGRVWARGIRSEKRLANDPSDPNWATQRVFHYEFSFLLENGSATLLDDGTIDLNSGDLYVQAKTVYDKSSPPVAMAAAQPLILYPLVTKKVVKTGSVSTEFLLRAVGNSVEVSFRSSHLAASAASQALGVWTSFRRPNGVIPPPGRLALANQVRTIDDDGRNDVTAAITAAQSNRYAELRQAAHAVGVKD